MRSGNLPLSATNPNRKKPHEVAAIPIKEPKNRYSPLDDGHAMVGIAITPAAAKAPHMMRCHFGVFGFIS